MEKQLYKKLHELLNEEKFEEAIKLIDDTFKTVSFGTAAESLFFKTKLYGFLTDIGCESQNESALNEAIKFFEANEVALESCITKSSYYYNLANAKHGLGKIFYYNHRGVHSINTVKEKFQEPIKLYWLAYKNLRDKDKNLLLQILINLSNSLVNASRIVEGLQFLDMVLRIEPNFPQALISRGDNLDYLKTVTNCSVTTSLFVNIFRSYDSGIKTNTLPPSILNRSVQHREESLNTIKEHGFNINDIDREIQESEKEFNNHSTFRKYCITNFLTLNEHSIYCNCVATEKDDLQIGVKHGMFHGDTVPQLELLLNRIKSEFALSRWLYFQSLQADSEVEYDTMFSELLDGEIINSQTEMQRTSFRLCYGILDKIALGICKLYNLDSKRIHFETFWDEKKHNEQLNQIKNIHLNALYSIACDLNTTTGELKQFKNWRNDLEHNLLVLKDTSKPDLDVFKLFRDKNFVEVADAYDFKTKTLHLMQLTRAAIFSFVYCVRLQTIHHKVEGYEKNSFVVDFKE
jgi:hypothetical protein